MNFPRWAGTLTVRYSTYILINTMPLITVAHGLANIKNPEKRWYKVGLTAASCTSHHITTNLLTMYMKPMCCIKIPRTYMGVECDHCNDPNHLG